MIKSYAAWLQVSFPAFELNTEKYEVSHRIQSECGKIRTRITQNTDTFYAVIEANCIVTFILHLLSTATKTKMIDQDNYSIAFKVLLF